MRTLSCIAFFSFAGTLFGEMPVVFPDLKKFNETGREHFVESSVPGDFKSPEGVVAAMLILGDQVKNKGLWNPFVPEAIKKQPDYKGALPLASYYRGARIDGKRFIVSFDGEAGRYLNNVGMLSSRIRGAIERTVRKNFPEVRAVEYELDGILIEGWDT